MKLLRCNRCGQEQEIQQVAAEDSPLSKMASTMNGMAAMKGWTQVKLVKFGFPLQPPVTSVDLCEDCREVFSEQFMKGASVHAITMPPGQNVLPHDNVPFQDCLLAFDPEKGGFICEHDDPERFLKLQADRAQNVAEGVPEQAVDKTGWVTCNHGIQCGCTSAEGMDNNGARCTCPCHLRFSKTKTLQERGLEQKAPSIGDWADAIRDPDHPLRPTLDENRRKIAGMADDMKTAGYAHSIPQRCAGDACSEQHTYTEGCLLAGVVRAPSENPAPNPCGHMYPGTPCDWNHCATPGRLISQQGEDLTEAYSEQEAAE